MDQPALSNSWLAVSSSSEPHTTASCDPAGDVASFSNHGSEEAIAVDIESEKEVAFDFFTDSGSLEPILPPSHPTRSNQKIPRKSASRRSRHTPAEWEAVKEPIVKYYVENDCTLSTVMEIMSKPPHNLHATLVSFLSRLVTHVAN